MSLRYLEILETGWDDVGADFRQIYDITAVLGMTAHGARARAFVVPFGGLLGRQPLHAKTAE